MSARVSGPLGAPVDAQWGWLADSKTAIIEMAMASGLQLLTLEQRDACVTSTVGTGQLIRAALDVGAQRVILAIGGSATNDGGSGMLSALGARFLDAQGQPLPPGGLALGLLARIDLSGFDPRLSDVCVEIAADVAARMARHMSSARKRARPRRRFWPWTPRSGTLPIIPRRSSAMTCVTALAVGRPEACRGCCGADRARTGADRCRSGDYRRRSFRCTDPARQDAVGGGAGRAASAGASCCAGWNPR